jgi:hypothetical protein
MLVDKKSNAALIGAEFEVGLEAGSGSIQPAVRRGDKAQSAQSNGSSFCVGQFGF